MRYALAILFLASSLQATLIPVRKERLLLWLPLNEMQGTELRDYSGYRSTATLVGAVAWVRDPGGYATSGGTNVFANMSDGGIFLPQTAGTRIETPALSRLNLNSQDFSILFMGSMEPSADNSIIMYYIGGSGAGCGSRNGWGLWQQRVLAGKSVVLSVANCGQANNYSAGSGSEAGALSDRFVHMWVVTRTGNNLTFYKDGKNIGTATMGGAFGDAGTQALYIGDGIGAIAAGELVGKVGAVAIWDVTLTADEVYTMWARQGHQRIQ